MNTGPLVCEVLSRHLTSLQFSMRLLKRAAVFFTLCAVAPVAWAAPGTDNVGPQIWNGGDTNVWEINDVDAGAGTDPGWDLLNITGDLTINATPGSKFTIAITSLTLANAPGDVNDFDNTAEYTWTIVKTTTGITGFDAAAINLDTSSFSNALGNGRFVIATANGGLDLVLRLLQAPSIVAGPVSQTAYVNSNVTFSVTASGSSTLSYQWKLNGTDIMGETGSTLTINSAQPANEGSYTVVVSNGVGSITSSAAALALFRDFGDAPDPTYPTLLANNGARHLIVPGFYLGTNVDAEVDGQPNSTATGDDLAGTPNDEDGVTFTTPLLPGQMATVEVVASAAGKLDAWIDFNADGDWADLNEQIFANTSLAAGANALTFAVPLTATSGSTFARFRFSSAGGLSFTGDAADGEVEDHAVAITPVADLALTKTDSPDPVAVSSNLTYTITVTNIGPSQATTVTVTDTLPIGVTYGSASSSQGSCLQAAGVVTCSLGTVAANGSATVTIIVIPTSAGSVSNYATVTATETDLNLANNSASSETTVKNPPVINTQPTGVTLCPGGTATFTVSASGAAPLSYQWRKGGVDLTGETADTLTIMNVQAGNAGSYTVRVSNDVGAVISDPATLTVNTPTTATGPANVVNACPGSTATFTTTPAGTGPFTFAWRKDGVPLGETSGTLTIVGVSAGDVATYCVEVTGTCNSVTNCATLTIAAAPTITAQPQTFNGVQGNSATFSVTATGAGTLTYQWRYNSVNLANGGQVSGATSATLTISSLNCTNEGTFDVIVSNCAGSTTSAAAALNVRPITAVYFDFETVGQYTNNLPTTGNGGTDPLTPVLSEVGSGGANNSRALDLITGNTSLSDSAFPAIAYDFSVNGRVLRQSIMFKAKAPAANDTAIQIGFASKPSRLDSGDEQVASMSVKVRSTAQPALTYVMEERHKVFTGTTMISSNTSGSFTLAAGNWYRLSVNYTNGRPTLANSFGYGATLVDMGPTGTTPGSTMSTIGHTNVVNADILNDSSIYADFRTRENAGVDLIDNFSINSAEGTVFFTCQPRSQTVLQGRPVTINAYIDGTPPFAYQWLKNDVPIPGATDWQYKIAAASAGDAANYKLQVTAGATTITSDPATLTVTPDLVGPVLVSAGSFDGGSVGVCFDEPLDATSATTPGNYSVSGAPVGYAQLRPDRKSVILYISPGISGAFTVTVSGVNDVYGNTITGGSMASGNVASQLSSLEIGGPLPSVSGNDAIYSCKDGDFDITAGGADVWGNSDQFRFTYLPKNGDFDVRVRIANQTIPNTILKSGLIVRENVDAASRAMHAIVNPPWPGLDRYETGQRTLYAGATAGWSVSGLNQGNRAATAPNSWLRMRRVNNTFTAYAASNGVDWVAIGQTTQVYPSTVLVGLEMCAHVQGRLGTGEFRSFGDFAGYPAAVINITTQPANTNIAAGQTASFTVAATVTGAPTSELQYQWQRSDGGGGFTNIPAANAASASFTTPALFGPDSGAQFRCIVRVSGGASATSSVATVTVTDPTAPTLLSANVLAGSSSAIVLIFSEPVSAGTADVAGNYTVTNAAGTVLTIASAAFFRDTSTIILTMAAPLPTGDYGVVVNNVQDRSTTPNTIAANTVRIFSQFDAPLQPVVVEMYEDLGNNGTVANLQTQAIYSQRQPTYISYSNLFGHNVTLSGSLLPGTSGTAQDQYGLRVYAHFIPPTNGNYKFWIRSDDSMQLFMNTNGPSGVRSAVVGSSTNTPAAEVPSNAIDDTTATKYLNFDKLNTGLTITPVQGASVVVGLRLATANDAPERDPATYTLEGANSPTGPWTLISGGNTGMGGTTMSNRTTFAPDIIFTNLAGAFTNSTGYTSYRLLFPTVRDSVAANSMQISEIQLLNAARQDVTDSGVVLIAENTAFNGSYSVGTTPANSKTNIFLLGGQRYFIEALLREGSGGDGFSVMWTDTTVGTAPANNSYIPSSALGYPAGSAPATPVVVELYTGPSSGATFAGSDLPSLATVTSHPKWGTAPDAVVYEKYFAFQPQLVNTRLDNYAGRMFSYFVAPSNGLYRFYLRSDDSSQLYMNTNAINSTDPGGMVLLGQLTAFTSAYTLVGQNVPLVGGQNYYIEARWKEGTGGDGIAMAFRAQSDAVTPPIGTVPEIAGGTAFALPTALVRVGPVTLAGIAPSSPVLSEGQTVTFNAVGLSGAQPYTFMWLKNGAFVADSVNYTTLPATPSDNGATYTLIVSNAFSSAQASATITVNTDTTAPAIVSVSSHTYLTNVIVTFSEPMKQATLLNAGNFQIPGLTIFSTYAEPSLRRVSLFTSPQTPGAPYTLSVNGLADNSLANNPLPAASVPFNAWQATGCEFGAVYLEVFTNSGAGNVAVSSLTSDPRYINNLADVVGYLNSLDYRSVPPLTGNGMENYGVRITGYFVPPSNGVYRFFIRSDDASQLFMNTNAVNSTDPAGKTRLADVPSANIAYTDVRTQTPFLTLTAGQPYYIEALMKEASGGDYVTITYRGDNSIPPNYEAAPATYFALPPNQPGDTTPPLAVRTYSLSGNSVVIEFNEPIDTNPSLSNPTVDPFNFVINDGVSSGYANAVTPRPDGRSLLLDVPQMSASTYTVDISLVHDQHCNVIEPVTIAGKVFALGQGLREDTIVGTATPPDPIERGTTSVDVNNFSVTVGGSDIWNSQDAMRFAYGQYTGDFDVRMRVESLIPRNNWSKAGLIARESLVAGSRGLSAVVTPSSPALDGSGAGANDYEAGLRSTVDTATTDWGQFRPSPVPYPNAWVRLRRVGNTFFAYWGTNGVNWVQFATTSIALPSSVYFGIGTTSHNNTPGGVTTAVYHDYGQIFPPTITDQPDDLTIVTGDTANFSVGVSGTAPFYYQWRRNGVNITDATNSTLVINNAAPANSGNYDVVVTNMNNSVTSSVAVLVVKEIDLGDAPAPYPTLLANNGARHIIVPGFYLGAGVDADLDGHPSALANGDDTTGTADEDGVVGATPFIRGQTASVSIMASAPGRLDAWIDWNRDGDWADAGEQVAASVPLAAGVNVLPLPIPASASDGPTYARLRFSSAGGLSYTGLAQDGEVEDYVILIENRPPVAVTDGIGAAKDTPLTFATSVLLANDSDPNGDSLTVTAVTSPSTRGGTVALSGTSITYTPPAGFVGGDSFNYTISDGHGGSATGLVCVVVNRASIAFLEPAGGWNYIYDGSWSVVSNLNVCKPNFTLDGSWSANNGSSEWDGSLRGAGNGLRGGISSTNGALTIEDIDFGANSCNNRKIYFEHNLGQDGITTSNLLNTGITIAFRGRLTQPDIQPPPETPDLPRGWGIFSGGKGMFGVHQLNNGQHSQIAFSLVTTNTPSTNNPGAVNWNFSSPGLTFNRVLTNTTPGGPTDSGVGAATNPVVALNPNIFHEFWITIQTNVFGTNGTHTIQIYIDGSLTPQTFNINAGNGNDGETGTNGTFIAIGLNNSVGQSAYDIDYYAYKQGVIAPASLNEAVAIATQPANTTVLQGGTATFTVGVSGTPPYYFQWFDNGVPITDATNSSYSRIAVCADNGHTFSVVVSNLCSQAASASAALTVTSTIPAVHIVLSGSDVVVSWPVTCEGYVLEETNNLEPGHTWHDAGGVASVVDNENRRTIAIVSTENRYYRLRKL
jgi:uncharacterized repeat protein (TIGR01451 family)